MQPTSQEGHYARIFAFYQRYADDLIGPVARALAGARPGELPSDVAAEASGICLEVLTEVLPSALERGVIWWEDLDGVYYYSLSAMRRRGIHYVQSRYAPPGVNGYCAPGTPESGFRDGDFGEPAAYSCSETGLPTAVPAAPSTPLGDIERLEERSHYETVQLHHYLEQARPHLSRRQYQYIRRTLVDGWSKDQVASYYGVRRKTIYSTLCQARHALQDLMGAPTGIGSALGAAV